MQRRELNDLLAFATVARERSFTRAAGLLSMSPSALSHAMRGLEERLGVRLLARTTRSVAPTEAGEQLLRSLTPALSEIHNGLANLAEWREAPSGTVRITTFAHAAQMVLEPVLPAFLMDNPNVRVEINIDNGLTDIVAAGFNAGIRFRESVDKDMIAVPVGPAMRTVVVGAPAYFERFPKPQTPADLAQHNCIGFRLTTSGSLLPWEFEHNGREINIRTNGSLVVNEAPLAAAAVREGAVLGYLMEHDVAEDMASGRLIQVLDEWCPSFPGYYLYHPSRRQMPVALRALIDALRFTP